MSQSRLRPIVAPDMEEVAPHPAAEEQLQAPGMRRLFAAGQALEIELVLDEQRRGLRRRPIGVPLQLRRRGGKGARTAAHRGAIGSAAHPLEVAIDASR